MTAIQKNWLLTIQLLDSMNPWLLKHLTTRLFDYLIIELFDYFKTWLLDCFLPTLCLFSTNVITAIWLLGYFTATVFLTLCFFSFAAVRSARQRRLPKLDAKLDGHQQTGLRSQNERAPEPNAKGWVFFKPILPLCTNPDTHRDYITVTSHKSQKLDPQIWLFVFFFFFDSLQQRQRSRSFGSGVVCVQSRFSTSKNDI